MTITTLNSPGLIAIYTERARQISVEGYTREHDAEHGPVVLINAALAYTVQAQDIISEAEGHGVGADGPDTYWPWDPAGFKDTDDEIASLTKAGALIAAALDVALDRKAGRV
ncbi:hypothetical protein ORI20_13910 [Mycobacterium sp. CVI_P3]|uniref:Uncharacterized protein n=1 Tax=Mycobacterium pinniadriaticum TaxID=2994102 RepID=A0ABT3SE66_9MYCO|nr:hypothetical protein [Mycobacterium pinniadriaticum]MCX2931375.1 hypothetical protein [Mycobacterium pinniadriaticum]MCX2937799.1 hypothetical protein [Mycobacterium pinniadriaticum]